MGRYFAIYTVLIVVYVNIENICPTVHYIDFFNRVLILESSSGTAFIMESESGNALR